MKPEMNAPTEVGQDQGRGAKVEKEVSTDDFNETQTKKTPGTRMAVATSIGMALTAARSLMFGSSSASRS